MSLTASRRADRIGTALSAARARSSLAVFIGHVEAYCHHADCAVRVVSFEVKEHDDSLPARLRCPACRHRLQLHHVLTLEEQREAFERNARISVNAQMYQRRAGDVPVPLGALLDDSLPGGSAS